MSLKNFLCKILSLYLYDKIRKYWRELREFALRKSIEKALREQGLSQLANKLSEIVPDITHQYSTFELDTLYLTKKVRGEHAFQISLVQKAINILKRSAKDDLTIVDIGDSAGTHIQYIKSLFNYQNIRTISINLDPEAVKRIKERGFKAICARAEEIGEKYHITADIFLCFKTLEHLMNPAEFLYKLSQTNCDLLVITVPYLLLFKFAGWSVVFERIYLQYPKKHWLWITKWYWRMFDFEGFYGVILKKDSNWSKLYTGW